MALGRELAHALMGKGLPEVAKIERTRLRPIEPIEGKHSATPATAETFRFKIPCDRLIHAIILSIGESVNPSDEQGTLADDILDIDLNTNLGHLKEMTGLMCKQVSIINKNKQETGYYTIYFTDPWIGLATPLPAWIFSSIELKLKDSAPEATMYHHLYGALVESEVPKGLDIGSFKILVERYLRHEKWGTSTGWKSYEHERAFKIFGYLYCMDDNLTLSDTVFDKLKVYGIGKDREHNISDEFYIRHLKNLNALAYMNPLDTGFMYLDACPEGYDSGQYTTLRTQLNIPTAVTDAGVRILERYLK